MDKRELTKQFLAGLFFVTGIFLIVMFTITIGKDKGFSEPKFQIVVLFKNVGGLAEGAPTRLSGVNIGNVGDIDFLDEDVDGRRVKVTLNIYERFRKQLKTSTLFTIKTEGVLGEKLVEIYSIANQPNIDLEKPIIGEDPLDIADLAASFAGAAESFTKTAEEMSKVDMVGLSEIMAESSRALLITSEGINSIMGELQAITLKSKRMFDRLEQKIIDGDLFKVF